MPEEDNQQNMLVVSNNKSLGCFLLRPTHQTSSSWHALLPNAFQPPNTTRIQRLFARKWESNLQKVSSKNRISMMKMATTLPPRTNTSWQKLWLRPLSLASIVKQVSQPLHLILVTLLIHHYDIQITFKK